jgi:hypothetical protein
MAKNKNTMKKDASAPTPPTQTLSSAGWRIVGAGGALVISGFVLLSCADAMGRNLPAVVSPFLLIAGYAAIGVGLFLPPPLGPLAPKKPSKGSPTL